MCQHIEAEQNCWHFADDIFTCIFFKEKKNILIQISLTFVLYGPAVWLDSIGSFNGLVPEGTKPLPEPMLTQWADVIWCH